jgi:hypothetical protein
VSLSSVTLIPIKHTIMRTFKITFIKVSAVQSVNSMPVFMAEQRIKSESDKFNINAPLGYAIFSVTEILKPVIILSHDKN